MKKSNEMYDMLGRLIIEGDIVVRPIFSNLRISKVLKIKGNSITLSCRRETLNFSFLTNNPNIKLHNEQQILRNPKNLLKITEDYDRTYIR